MPWIFTLIFVFFIFYKFLEWIRKMGWRLLSKKFPLPKGERYKANHLLKYGLANIGGIYKRNAVFSDISERGVFIRKPFPFDLFMPSIFLPWEEISQVKIVGSIDGESSYGFSEKLFSYKYAKIKLLSLATAVIIIPWKKKYTEFVPIEKLESL